MKKIFATFAVLSMFGFSGMALAGSHNPCSMESHNPCSMKGHNPCDMKGHNPCDMKSHNPCDMKSHNPCDMKGQNPCSMKMMNPCSGSSMSDEKKPIRQAAFSNFQEAADVGRQLWNDEKLGTADVSCLSCHSGYDNLNLEKRQNFPHYVSMVGDVVTLDQMINYCMINPMNGKQFEKNSKELTAMAAYYRAYRMQFLRESN